MKEILKKITEVCRKIFGYGIMAVLFAGAAIFFGYIAALIIGGDAAVMICEIIYKKIVPVMIYATTSLVLFGLAIMYLSGEMALSAKK